MSVTFVRYFTPEGRDVYRDGVLVGRLTSLERKEVSTWTSPTSARIAVVTRTYWRAWRLDGSRVQVDGRNTIQPTMKAWMDDRYWVAP